MLIYRYDAWKNIVYRSGLVSYISGKHMQFDFIKMVDKCFIILHLSK